MGATTGGDLPAFAAVLLLNQHLWLCRGRGYAAGPAEYAAMAGVAERLLLQALDPAAYGLDLAAFPGRG